MSQPESQTKDMDGISMLYELALDLRALWDRSNDDIWRRIDPEVWVMTRNPWLLLQTASPNKLKQIANGSDFRERVEQLVLARDQYMQSPEWFQLTHGGSLLGRVAYFSMEFGLSEALPIYSGGLGNVAGDQLKAGSDLGVPIIGVGLLYQQGYFRQAIDPHGRQRELFPYNDPEWLPMTAVRDEAGELVRIEFDFPGHKLWLRVWEVRVGRVKLYLLDSNDPGNPPMHRGITSELYGGGTEMRLTQELVIGIGGWRVLRRLGLEPKVCHLNEGHAAFAVLERALW